MTHPHYTTGTPALVSLGDTVALADDDDRRPVGTVTAVYPEAVEVSTGDDYRIGDLALVERAVPQ